MDKVVAFTTNGQSFAPFSNHDFLPFFFPFEVLHFVDMMDFQWYIGLTA
mgnify:FL=1